MTVARIKPLPLLVYNQIAAGEVIERPASVVKELLENALDSGATEVHVSIGFGGLNSIAVSDNGSGIVADDLCLAIAPHATSKLSTLDDLTSIDTMGFRGEALASIASVSKLTIQSRPIEQADAMCLRMDADGVLLTPCARSVGTTVEVLDLFYNAPVRKKFLKAQALEYLAIEAVVKRFALSEPSVGLRLSHNGKLKLRLLPVDGELSLRLRLKKLLGHRFIASALSLDTQHEGMRLQGFISGLDYSRSHYDKQWVYLNRRMVRDKLILHAIRVAYEPLLSRGRYAVCFLHLTLSLDAVDVNVHPTKHEVRFHQPREVHDFIRLSITEAFQQAPVSQATMNLTQQVHMISCDHRVVSSVCVSLNSRYALVMDEGIAHLVDMSLVRLDMMRSLGRLNDSPWLSRPLLVPVVVVCEALDTLRAYVNELAQFGFIFSCEETNRVLITAIPRDLPALDLHHFIHALVSQQPQRESCLELLLKADAWDLTLISDEEKHELMTYWQHHRIASRPLDEARCEAFIDV